MHFSTIEKHKISKFSMVAPHGDSTVGEQYVQSLTKFQPLHLEQHIATNYCHQLFQISDPSTKNKMH